MVNPTEEQMKRMAEKALNKGVVATDPEMEFGYSMSEAWRDARKAAVYTSSVMTILILCLVETEA